MTNRKSYPGQLSVGERVAAVIALRKNGDLAKALSISELSRLAKVSRASLYVHHSDLLRELQEAKKKRGLARGTATEKSVGQDSFRKQIADLKIQNKALLFLCVELQSRLNALQVKPRDTTIRE